LILHRLGHQVGSKPVTYAQVLAQTLLDRALAGHFGALEEILTRIDGDAKTTGPATKTLKPPINMAEAEAQRIVDAPHDV
jgi:hypothetical protein